MKTSVIIPVFNEESVIKSCLASLSKQTRPPDEMIVVDDGSTDKTFEILSKFQVSSFKFQVLKQDHHGPGAARNLGVQGARGEILVFVDSDMTFAPDFLENLVKPIEQGKTKGTFTKEEYVSNWNIVWSRCWNYNNGLSTNRRLPENYPNTAPVFRAILVSEFKKVEGFTEGVGWTDDWSMSKKLGYKSTVTDARCYHDNPSTLGEVYVQARWIGKNELLRKTGVKTTFNLIRYSFLFSLIIGLLKTIYYWTPEFLSFKVVYDVGITSGLIQSFLGKDKNK